MISRSNDKVEIIPVEQINVVNPRSRGQAKFRQIIDNIANLGLKRPITLARRTTQSGSFLYDLVCGQGRLEACRANGSKVVPAIVLEAIRAGARYVTASPALRVVLLRAALFVFFAIALAASSSSKPAEFASPS